jgi:thiamine-phosphate pyrophosphorylase
MVASMFEPASIVLAGSTLDSLEEAAETGVDFVAARLAVWDHPEGPAAAVRQANKLLDAVAERRKAETA